MSLKLRPPVDSERKTNKFLRRIQILGLANGWAGQLRKRDFAIPKPRVDKLQTLPLWGSDCERPGTRANQVQEASRSAVANAFIYSESSCPTHLKCCCFWQNQLTLPRRQELGNRHVESPRFGGHFQVTCQIHASQLFTRSQIQKSMKGRKSQKARRMRKAKAAKSRQKPHKSAEEELGMQRMRKAKKPRSQEAKKPRSQEAKKPKVEKTTKTPP